MDSQGQVNGGPEVSPGPEITVSPNLNHTFLLERRPEVAVEAKMIGQLQGLTSIAFLACPSAYPHHEPAKEAGGNELHV